MAKKHGLKAIEKDMQAILAQMSPADLLELKNSMGQLVAKLDAPVSQQEEKLDEAQQLMFDAMESKKKSQRIKLANKALDLSPLCADAYLMLAHDLAETDDEHLDLLLSAASAGEGAMELRGYGNRAGEYWGIIETRPYMRALHDLGLAFFRRNEMQEAKEVFQRMLKLNPNDNQGVRYCLLEILVQLGDVKSGLKLHKKYKNEHSAFWSFGGALLAFMENGDGPDANLKLVKAQEINAHVTAYLSGQKKLPKQLPGFYSPGQDNEAQSYLEDAMTSWQSVPGALQWLKAKVLGKPLL